MIFTQKNETADDRIERLVYEYRDVYGEISVATSDAAEQQVAFGGGALRISADELRRRLAETAIAIGRNINQRRADRKPTLSDTIRQDVANILENWRRR